jgi:hypothetical protein
VVVWDNLNTHVSRAMAELIAARDWLTIFQLPPYAHGERSQGRHGAQPDIRIGAGGALGDIECGFHARQHMLTRSFVPTHADGLDLGAA